LLFNLLYFFWRWISFYVENLKGSNLLLTLNQSTRSKGKFDPLFTFFKTFYSFFIYRAIIRTGKESLSPDFQEVGQGKQGIAKGDMAKGRKQRRSLPARSGN